MTKQTDIGNRIKKLKQEAAQHQRAINAAQRLARAGIPAQHIIRDEQSQRDQALAEAQELRDSGIARLEDLRVYRVERAKETKKGKKTHEYFYASWRHGEKVVNQYLGSTKKMDYDSAMMKARQLKAEDLGIHLEEDSVTS
jgi:hypothetical protein